MAKESEVDKLNEALSRLALENAAWRTKVENALTVIRHRAPNADGLSFEAAVKTILDDRDLSQDRVQFYRNELKEILNFLLTSTTDDDKKANEIRKRINLFLYKNQK